MSIFTSLHVPDPQWLARAEPEDVLEPELPIVDAHHHLWMLDGKRYFVEEFAADVADSGHAVQASVFVECFMAWRADGPEHLKCVGEVEFAVGQAALAASGKFTRVRAAQGIVGFADLTRGAAVREVLEAQVAAGNGRFKGIRQRAKWDPDPEVRGAWHAPGPGMYLEPRFGEGIDVLGAMGLSFDASVFHPQIPDVTALARAHPGVTIALNHCGSPIAHGSYGGRPDRVHADWVASLRELATCPNVTIKLGGLLMCLGTYDFTTAPRPLTSRELADLWRPWIEPCIELFGPDRCMVSSNFPVDKAGLSCRTLWNMFKRVTAGCSKAGEGCAVCRHRAARLPPRRI